MRAKFETMERRVLMAVTATFNAGTGILDVAGDDLDNQIVITRDATGTILINGGVVPIAGGVATVSNTVQMQLLGGAGNDGVTLNETSGALPAARMLGEAGDDTLLGGSGDDTLVGGAGSDDVRGAGGNDRIVWNPDDGSDFNEGGDGADTIEVNGTDDGEQFTLTANGTRVRFDRLNAGAFFLDIGTAENLDVRANGGADSFSSTGNIATLIHVAVDGGAGNDTLLGSNGADQLTGGDDDDFIDGQQGNDAVFLGAGNDTFQWDPGDGSDGVEGGAGNDRMLFNGSAGSEIYDASASAGRLRFTRNLGNIVMDVDDVERITLNLLGGVDAATINDLAGTDVTDIDVNAAGLIGGTTGDAAADGVVIKGTAGGDNFSATESGGAIVAITSAVRVNFSNFELANDKLTINGLAGPDTLIVNGSDAGDQITMSPSGTNVRVSRANLTPYFVESAETENVVINGLDGNDVVSATGDLAALTQLSIDGGAGNDTITGGNGPDALIGGEGDDQIDGNGGDDVVFLGAGDDTFVWDAGDGADVVEGEAGADRVVFHGTAADEDVEIAAAGQRVRFFWDIAPAIVDIGGVESITYDALAGADAIVVRDLSGTDVSDVTLNLAGAPAGQAGDAETDTLTLEGTSGADHVVVSSIEHGTQVGGIGATVNILAPDQTLDQLTVRTFGGIDTVTINALTAPAVAKVTLDLWDAGGTPELVVVNGDENSNNITVSDTAAGTEVAGLTTKVVVSTSEPSQDTLRINGAGGSDVITVNQTGTSGAVRNVTAHGGAGADTIAITSTATDGAVTVAPSIDNDSVVVSPTPTGHAVARFDEAIRLASLTVNSGGRANLTPAGNKVLTMNSLAINGTGRFDLADNSAIIDYAGSSPIATIQQRLASGYNGGAWNGLGIISSTAAGRLDTGIGYAEATDLFSAFPATFRGESIDGTSILLTHTLYGDADLNRTVNLDDFNRLATNFGASGRRWAHGDSTYDQTVNLNDFNALAANFGRTAAGAEAGAGPHAASGSSSKRVADDVLER